jgi:hypothetical protein
MGDIPMRRFLSSAWFPFLMCLVLAGTSVAAFAVLKPAGTGIDNSQLLYAMKISGWVIGPVAALLSVIVIGILNLIRRIIRLRKNSVGHLVVVLLGLVPWLVFSWVLLDEPPYTDFGVGVMEFAARPLLWGSLVATLLALALSLPFTFSSSKK